MKLSKLIFKSFIFYFRKNVSIAVGVALSTAIITGALIVGDSMKYSLNQSVHYRLGDITHTITAGDKLFTDSLAIKISDKLNCISSSVLLVNGNASLDGGKSSIRNLSVWGLDDNFNKSLGTAFDYKSIKNNEVIISENIARKFNLNIGDDLLLKMQKTGLIPANTPFSSNINNIISRHVIIKDIVHKNDFSRVNFQNSQTAPNNIFVSGIWLNQLMDLSNKANLILISGENKSTELISQAFYESWNLEDVNLNISNIESQNVFELTSGQIFINDLSSDKIKESIPKTIPVINYFVNSISSNYSNCPYSFISTLNNKLLKENEIIINKWLSDDLKANVGDTISIEYFKIGPLKELETYNYDFKIKRIVEIDGQYADTSLMPSFPGLTDAGNCRDWETDIPVDLSKIREKDEDYWDNYKGIPKAFINIDIASQLWNNRFGTYTSLRFDSDNFNHQTLYKEIKLCIDPFKLNFQINDVKKDGLFAAGNGTDFSQLFIGLSFFIIMSALILTVLLFIFNLETRSSQLGTLTALGFSKKDMTKIIMSEGFITTITGAIAGSILAIFYNEAVISFLSGSWNDIVRTSILETQIDLITIFTGFLISVVISLIALRIGLSGFFKKQVINLQNKQVDYVKTSKTQRIKFIVAIILFLSASGIILFHISANSQFDFISFFIAGTNLLISSLLFTDILFNKLERKTLSKFGLYSLGIRNIVRNRKSGIRIIILLSLGVFIIISTGSNRKDIHSNLNNKSSGTGGFLYVAESNIPILEDLTNKDIQRENGIIESKNIIQFKVNRGDDASCLNLNRISQPRIIAVTPQELNGRFKFVTKTDYLNSESPWESLNLNLDDVIPAIADQTVIQWSLGKKVGDTLNYVDQNGNDLKLLLIGGLAGSVFQGNVIISDQNFKHHFPASSGSGFFLIEGDIKDTALIEKEYIRAFRDYGLDMAISTNKLAEFKSVENTYLMIFLLLGMMGLLIGTVGLAIILIRDIRERRPEFAIFVACGYSKWSVIKLLSFEYSLLLISGTFIGTISALIAVLPSLLNINNEISISFLIILIGIIIVHGLLWIITVSVIQLMRINPAVSLRDE